MASEGGLQGGSGVVEEVEALFLAGADDRLEMGEDFRAARRAIHAAVGSGGGDAADVAFGQVVIGRDIGFFQERE